jgi:outer membrane protein TolC
MFEISKYFQKLSAGRRQSTVALAACLLFGGVVAAQTAPVGDSKAGMPLPALPGVPLTAAFPNFPGIHAIDVAPPASGFGGQVYDFGPSSTPNPGKAPAGVRRITLDEAKQLGEQANSPLVRLAKLQVEAAKQHRLGVQAMYFPNISGQLENLHLNHQTGIVLSARRPNLPGSIFVPVNIFAKNSTAFNFSAVQPVTPLLAIHQLVKIARADENIARAKAGMSVAETASRIERAYYGLLIAERELIIAKADARKVQGKWLRASSSAGTSVSTEQETDMIGAEKAVALPASKVKELTASLNEMLGLPQGTRLELVPPEPLVEHLSLQEVTDKAGAATNPEVVEAEQTAVKAHAASALSKMAYFPSAAIVGGYANQNLINDIVLPQDFSYIGFIATYTVFDFGKREHGVKESTAQAQAADLAVQLTKAKAAAAVKSNYFELERSRQLAQLARRMVSATQVMEASYQPENPEVEAARARMEVDMFRAECEYRQAYARLKNLLDGK